MSKLHHVAIATTEFERYKKIFEQLGMTKSDRSHVVL